MFVSLSAAIRNSRSLCSTEAMGLYATSVVSTTDVCIGLGENQSNSELRDRDMFDGDSQTYTSSEKISFCKPRYLAAFLSPLRDSSSSCLALANSSPQLNDQILSRLIQRREIISRGFSSSVDLAMSIKISPPVHKVSRPSLGTTPEDRSNHSPEPCQKNYRSRSPAEERMDPRRWVQCRRACPATPPLRVPPDERNTEREDP